MKYRGGCAEVRSADPVLDDGGRTGRRLRGCGPRRQVPEPAAVADDEQEERREPQARARTAPSGTARSGSSRGSAARAGVCPSSAAPQRGDCELRRASPARRPGAARGRPCRPGGGAGGSSVDPLGATRRRASTSGSPSSPGSPPRVSSVLATPSSHRSISWVNETSLENSAPTDSPRWIRLIASPMSGATESVVILASRFARGSGTESVRTTSRRLEARDAGRPPGRSARRAWRRRRSR